MAHRNIEILIGRLITDEAFRSAFLRDAATTLTEFIESGYELTHLEITAVECGLHRFLAAFKVERCAWEKLCSTTT